MLRINRLTELDRVIGLSPPFPVEVLAENVELKNATREETAEIAEKTASTGQLIAAQSAALQQMIA